MSADEARRHSQPRAQPFIDHLRLPDSPLYSGSVGIDRSTACHSSQIHADISCNCSRGTSPRLVQAPWIYQVRRMHLSRYWLLRTCVTVCQIGESDPMCRFQEPIAHRIRPFFVHIVPPHFACVPLTILPRANDVSMLWCRLDWLPLTHCGAHFDHFS